MAVPLTKNAFAEKSPDLFVVFNKRSENVLFSITITVTIIIAIIVINIITTTIIITTVNFYFLLSDIFVFVFVVTFLLRRLVSFWLYLQTLSTIPRYQRNWRHFFPEPLTSVECASLLCFITAFSLWITRWNQLHGWRPSDKYYQFVDVFYCLASLLCFFKLAHYLKVRKII